MTRKAALLEDRGVVQVGGEDASSFLQGLLTNDVERLSPSEARYAALLSPQGKILFDMLVVRAPGDDRPAYLLDCAAAQAADLARRLGFYKLRARVAVADVSLDHGVVAGWGEEPETAGGGIVYRDPRTALLGWRAILPRAKAEAFGGGHVHEYDALRIALAVPKGGVDFAYGDAFPHDANLDTLQGVDFGKGCYVGQEVVSRMRHRGTARKRIAQGQGRGGRAAAGNAGPRRRACGGNARLVGGARGARDAAARSGRGGESRGPGFVRGRRGDHAGGLSRRT